jgi:hypothetical protein
LRRLEMLDKPMMLAAILILSSLGFAQARTQQEAADPAAPSKDTSCAYSYSSGSPGSFTSYCLTGNGNIVQFASPSDFEFIKFGIVSEGYGFCDFTPATPVPYFDYAHADSGNWGPTTVTTPSATSKRFVRMTSDGIWQLTQTITQIKATNSTVGSVKIVMVLKNLTGTDRVVYLIRYADVDAGSTPIENTFISGINSAYGMGQQVSYGLGLTTNTLTFPHTAFTQNEFDGPAPCSVFTNLNGQPFTGDGSIGHLFAIEVPPGAARNVTVTYKPI